jgi:DNA uptake protein ComE-like DNA-binding protein
VFSKQQRYGVFLLVLAAVLIQIACYTNSKKSVAEDFKNSKEIERAISELDSLKLKQQEQRFKIYPFNPNYISDYKGYTLGMSTQEIDRLFDFRKQNKWIKSVKEFQKVTGVSDSLLHTIKPYFKFPNWVHKNQSKINTTTSKYTNTKFDLNSATKNQLMSIYGIGESYSKRILLYREKRNGFSSYVELKAIYGLTPETIQNIKLATVLLNPRKVAQFNLNTITRSELVTIPYIDYELAFKIIEYRTLRDGFVDIEELLKINDFPYSKFDIIKLSLYLLKK